MSNLKFKDALTHHPSLLQLQMPHSLHYGPLPPSHEIGYILTCINHFTRWPEAIPISNIVTETVACALIHSELDISLGCPFYC